MRNYFLCLIFLVSMFANAQTPKKFNYQAIARDAAGNFIANQMVSYDIAIRQTTFTGTVVYEETHQPTTNNYGLVNLSIGTGTIVTGTMASINWANGPYFLEVKIDPAGGTTYTLAATQELMSVPYALYAENSGTPGPQGNPGVGIDTTYVQTDSLFIKYTDGTLLNAGYVKGNTGPQGVSVTNAQVNGGTLTFTLSNSTTINAGQLPDKSFIPFSFTTAYTTSTNLFSSAPVQVMVPPLYGSFTSITAELTINYLTTTPTTTGNVGLMDYGNWTGGAITPISGSVLALPTTNNVWTNISTSSFTVTPGTLVRVIWERVGGTGSVQIQGALLTLKFN